MGEMDETELRTVVHSVVAEVVGVAAEEISDATDLRADFDVDSLELLEIGARIERELNIQIKVEDIATAQSVGHAVDLLRTRLSGGGPDQAPAEVDGVTVG